MTTGWTEVTAAIEKPTVPNTDDDHAYRDRPVSRQLLEKAKGLPEALQSAFVPTEGYIFEWKDYWLDLPDVDRLRVGQTWQEPEIGTWFRLKFENQIGLTSVQPYAVGQPTEDPTHLCVVSKKFPTPTAHEAFFQSLLDDLYIRAARLPFTIHTPTAIHTSEAIRPPMPLFTLHFLCQHTESLLAAIRVMQADPHRRLTEIRERIPLAEATGIDSDVILDILHNPDEWQEAALNLRIAQTLHGSAPRQVLQSRAVESFDTPENRFVRHFLQSVLAAADDLPSQPWWPLVSSDRQAMVTRCRAVLQQALNRSPLRESGPMHVLPVGSQVLLRREGYREMLSLWQFFQQGRRPLFAQLRNAIDLRDIATLYEIWVFFALVDDIAEALDVQPVLTIEVSTLKGLTWGATANYGRGRKLLYNRGFRQPNSYSLALRPDYAWIQKSRIDVVFDAKFALESLTDDDDDSGVESTAKRRDLYKMHTYRDALGVRAAVALYPGTQHVFYPCTPIDTTYPTLNHIVSGDIQGVGAIPLRPES